MSMCHRRSYYWDENRRRSAQRILLGVQILYTTCTGALFLVLMCVSFIASSSSLVVALSSSTWRSTSISRENSAPPSVKRIINRSMKSGSSSRTISMVVVLRFSNRAPSTVLYKVRQTRIPHVISVTLQCIKVVIKGLNPTDQIGQIEPRHFLTWKLKSLISDHI